MPSPYITDEAPSDLWLEQTIFAAGHIGAIAYGIHIFVLSQCVYYIWKSKKPSWLYLIYVVALFILASINLACNVNFNEQMWLDDRSYPGGPLAFLLEQQSRPVNTLGNSVTSITGVMADSLLIWRCYMIWGKRWYIVILPVFALLSSTVLTILTIIQASRPFSSLWTGATQKYALPYWSLLPALNVSVTLLMVSRLLWVRLRVRRMLGSEHSKTYTNVIAMIVESALPYAIVSFIYVILYGTNNPAQNLFLPLFAQVQCIAPELIIMRVSRGRAWSSDTAASLTGPPPMPRFAIPVNNPSMPSTTTLYGSDSISGVGKAVSIVTFRDNGSPGVVSQQARIRE